MVTLLAYLATRLWDLLARWDVGQAVDAALAVAFAWSCLKRLLWLGT